MMQVEEAVTLGVQQAREGLRARIDAALENGEHTVITRTGRPVAVLVPYSWYQRIQNQPVKCRSCEQAIEANEIGASSGPDYHVCGDCMSLAEPGETEE